MVNLIPKVGNKNECIVLQPSTIRTHISQFFQVEQIIKDECIVAVYELLDNFCEFILLHISYIRRHKYDIFLLIFLFAGRFVVLNNSLVGKFHQGLSK